MSSGDDNVEPDICLVVGQDLGGHWLVCENHGLIGGIFVSRDAAMRFAREELCAFPGATIIFAGKPLPSPLTAPMEKAA